MRFTEDSRIRLLNYNIEPLSIIDKNLERFGVLISHKRRKFWSHWQLAYLLRIMWCNMVTMETQIY